MLQDFNVYIIVPVYNRADETLECIRHIKSMDYKRKTTILIDDGSTDGTEKKVKNKYPDIIIIKGDGNFWWAKSINIGISYAIKEKADYVMLLNNDCIVEEKLLTKLVSLSLKYPNTIVAPRVLDYYNPKREIFSGKIEDWSITPFKKVNNKKNIINEDKIIQTDIIYGKGTLIQVEHFKTIGFFDDKLFPHYHSDVDFSLRAKQQGINMLIANNCIVWDKSTINENFFSFKTYFSRKSNLNIFDTYKLYQKHSPYKFYLVLYLLFYISRISNFILSPVIKLFNTLRSKIEIDKVQDF